MDLTKDISLLRMRYGQNPTQYSPNALQDKDDPKQYNRELRKASDGFEEMFVHQLLREMRKSIPKTNLMDGGRGEEIFEDMLDENYAKIITESRAFGLSDVIYEANKKQETRQESSLKNDSSYRKKNR